MNDKDETEIRSMSDELRGVKRELREVRAELAVITACVKGDKAANPPRPGILDYLQTHKDDLYGNTETQHTGLKEKMEAYAKRLGILEDDRKKIYWMSAGISLSFMAAWAAVKMWFKIP